MERPWPLTGRDVELTTVLSALRPGAAGVLVAGAAGVGKTRLVREALARAPSSGRRVVWAHGSSAARSVPLGAFAGAVPEVMGERGRGADAVARLLEAVTGPGPVVLAVDDAHLLDELSAIAVHRAVTRRLAQALVTIRAGEAVPDLVTALWKDDHLPRIDLTLLDPDATGLLVARALGGPVEEASVRRLWSWTRGSPLFLRHLVSAEARAGRLAARSGQWRWTDDPVLSPELSALLNDELGALAPDVQDVIDAVALAEPVAVATLERLASAAAVEVAESRGLLRIESSEGGDLVRLAHPLYGEVRRTGMGALRARRLRGRVATTLDPSAHLLARAVLTLGSDLPPDRPLFLQAARAAIRLYDLPLAERLSRAAASDGAAEPRLVHASALSWLSRGQEAEDILCKVAAGASPGSATRAMAHLMRTGNLLFTLGREGEAAAALEAADQTGEARLLVRAMTLVLAVARGDVDAVQERGPDLLREAAPDELAALLTASAVAAVAAVTGRSALLERAATVGGFTDGRVPTGIPGFGLADWQVLGHRLAGRTLRAVEVGRRMLAAAGDLPAPARLMGLVVAAHAALAQGRVADALVLLEEAWRGLGPSSHEFRFRCRTLLGTALAMAGRPAEARPLLDVVATERHPAYRLYEPDDLLGRAWGAAAEGASSEAVRLGHEAARTARELRAPAHEVMAWQTLVQWGQAAPALPRLTALSGFSPRADAALEHALALDGRDAGRLLDACGTWTGLGDLVPAADAAAQAAAILARRGLQGSALAAAARAERLAASSGARTPALALAIHPLPLTLREREIAGLAARGLSNREIAHRLSVSVRTVEGHLYRAGHKLGVTERAGFALLLAPDESG